ncbi:hypothetical protein LCGC14_1047300 [marine sediment metagenome]|uniref:Uncharacterized protein n=1 Tax=marine sediment metagenome TaxID=412755 RepID=A0A0F9MUH2_9ZZZZ
MFNIKVSYGSGNSFNVRQLVVADCLPEAEESALAVLTRLFPDIEFVLVHNGDLSYNMYRVDEPMAVVNISIGGDNV